MKRKALITYFSNGDFKTITERQVMLKNLTEQFEAEGKELNMEANFTFGTITSFTDGSEIISMPIESVIEGEMVSDLTHVFASNSLKEIPKGMEALNTKVVPLLSKEGNLEFDTSGKRINFYKVVNFSLQLN